MSEYHKLKKAIESDDSLTFIVPQKLTKSDQLIIQARKDLKDKQPTQWHNATGLIVSSGEVLNIEVSKSNISRALRFMNSLIKLLKQRGHYIIVEQGKTLVAVNDEKIQLRCRETLKRIPKLNSKWQRYNYVPSGTLKLKLENTYPYKEWKDSKRKKLEDQLSNILTYLELKSKEEKRKRAEREEWNLQYEIQRKKEEELKQLKQEEIKNFRELYKASDLLHKANVMRHYIRKVKERAIVKGKLSTELKDWIEWANKKADWIDPLTNFDQDELLGEFNDDYVADKTCEYSRQWNWY